MNFRSSPNPGDSNPNQARSTNVEIINTLLKSADTVASGYQILEKGYEYWTYDINQNIRGVIAYVKFGQNIVVPGLPIVEEAYLADCLRQFQQHWQSHRIVFVGVEQRWLDVLTHLKLNVDALCIGEQPEWHRPSDFSEPSHRTFRSQVRRAERKGVVIEEIDTRANHPQHLHDALDSLVQQWRAQHHLATFAFMVRPEVGLNRQHAHLFVAYEGKSLVGLLSSIPTTGHQGWYFEDLIRSDKAPNGTVEALVHRAFKTLQTDAAPFVTLGMVPLSRWATSKHRRPLLQQLLRCTKLIGRRFYNFEGLKAFKSRFRPDHWEPMYMLTLDRTLDFRDLISVGKALAGGSLFGFLLRSSVLRLKQLPVKFWRGALAALVIPLAPWTILLAACDGAYWLGSESIQWAWVTFDCLLAAGLLTLFHRLKSRSSEGFAWVLGGATLADSVLSVVQALSLHQSVNGWTLLFVLAGVLGPIFATITLCTLAWVNPRPSLNTD